MWPTVVRPIMGHAGVVELPVAGALPTGTVEPAPDAPRVEQVGWGVARQVVARLVEAGVEHPLLDVVAELAERPGHAAYACFEGTRAHGLALLRLDGVRARHLGQALAPTAPPGLSEAFVARMLHDAGRAGAARLLVPPLPCDLSSWGLDVGS